MKAYSMFSRFRRLAFLDKAVAVLAVVVATMYGGAKNGATNEPDRASGPAYVSYDESRQPARSEGGEMPTNVFLRIDALFFTNDAAMFPVSWTSGLLASGSVISVWGATDALTNDFFKMYEHEVAADGLTNAVLSVPFTNELHSAAFFSLRSNADADGDGLCDYVESVLFGSDPHLPDTNGDGFTDLVKWRLGLVPTNAPPDLVEHSSTISSVAICPAFDLTCTNGIDGAFYSRTFAVGRDTPFRQFFLSSSPTGSAPVVFGDIRIDYRDSNCFSGAVFACSSGGVRLQLSTNALSSVTVDMHATGGNPWSAAPLYLVSYEPTMQLSGTSGRCTITNDVSAELLLGTTTAGVSLDWSGRPCDLPLSEEEERALDFFPCVDGVMIVDLGGQSRGIRSPASPGISFPGPGLYGLPGGCSVFVMLPSVSYGTSHCYAGTGIEWNGSSYTVKSVYPLDSECLWESWTRGEELAYGCSCQPELYAGVDTERYPFVTASLSYDNESASGSVRVNGVEVWHDTATHDVQGGRTNSDALEDACCSGGCASGSCDEFEGDGLGSVRFRIPLGLTAKDRIAGFLWFERDEPFAVAPSAFSILVRPDATVSDVTEDGVRRVVCSDLRGRTVCVSNIASGVGIAITDTESGAPVRSWEITNPSAVAMRFRKISKRGNVMSDRTYVCTNGVWSRVDNVSGEETTLSTYGDPNYSEGYLQNEREVRCGGRVVEHVFTEHSVVGWGENGVPRETYRKELGADGAWKETSAFYWDDWECDSRHGQLRFVCGDDRPWQYLDYDDLGREVLRIEQRDGSPAPNDWEDWTADDLPQQKAFVTVSGYVPLPGDSGDARDVRKVRCESRYVSENGAKTLVGRTWRRYVRGSSGGLPTVTVTTMRASSAGPDDLGNAVSTEIRYADDAGAVPLVMRGALVASLGEDGVSAACEYAITNGVVLCETRKSGPEGPHASATGFPTYETTEVDAAYGNVLRRTTRLADGDAVIADERMVYDDQNRLRSTTWLDGTSETNAYSCCRLLWRRDATGARTLRSATTGTDHLYFAEEEVGVRDLPRNPQDRSYHHDAQWSEDQHKHAYPVVQHFFDGLGRETNTVHRSAQNEGEAVSPTFPHRGGYVVSERRTFPQGVSDVEERVDGRGLRTIRHVFHAQSGEETVEEEWEPGASAPSVVVTNLSVRGGGTVSWRGVLDAATAPSLSMKWTCARRFSAYSPDGCRVDYDITESSDGGIVTNSVSAYDFLGRISSVAEPLGVTAYAYDGSSSRILSSTCAAGDVLRTAQYVYNPFGERVGETVDGVTTRTDVTYETDPSNVAWRVETAVLTGGGATNSVSATRTRLTGLSDALRSETVELRDGAEVLRTTTAWDDAAGAVTQCVWSVANGASWAKFVHGLEVESVSPAGRVATYYSPLGRPFFVMRSRPYDDWLQHWRLELVDGCGDVGLRGVYHGASTSTLQAAYYGHDCRGSLVETVDEAGCVVTNTVDAEGNVVASGGATYPVIYAYDTAGRRVAMATTRDGENDDVTQWGFDAATGLCTNKVYADGSNVAYTYTPDGLPLRTTYASGRWKENSYDARRNLSGACHSDSSLDFSILSDVFGRVTNVTDAAGGEWRYEYGRGDSVLNEEFSGGPDAVPAIACATNSISRTFDAVSRQTGSFLSVNGVAKGGVGYSYGDDGLLADMSVTNAAGRAFTVAYSNLSARCYGYVITTPGGAAIHRIAARNAARRDLLNSCTTMFNGVTLDSHTYTYDVLSRPTAHVATVPSPSSDTVASSFAYNERSEVVAAQIGTNSFAHAYDFIGNQTLFAENAVTNAYTHNALNQIETSQIISALSASLREIYHDLDGNLTNDCVFTYSYDAANRLSSVSSNGVSLVANRYDYKGRRIRKTTPTTETTFVYDGWHLIHETVVTFSGATTNTTEIQYFWGADISETLQGAGGVGGQLAVSLNNNFYFPTYDNNGNVSKYIDESGNIVAAYEYDDFGKTISQSGSLADFFRHRFSTKYYDVETGLYYYGYRFYSPSLMRWLNRDPIGEDGGLNLYGFCGNNAVSLYDMMGLSCKLGTFNVLRLDTWEKPAANGLSTNPNFIKNGETLLSSLGIFGNLTTLSSLSPSALANFQTFVDALAGKGTTPSADALEGIRRLYEHLKHGPVTIYGELEYELCVCKGSRTVFEKQEPIKDNETVFDRSDQLEVIRARGELLKWMINEMYKKKRRK